MHRTRQINTERKRNFNGDEVICPFVNEKLATNLIMFRSQLCVVISICVAKLLLQFVKLIDANNFSPSIEDNQNVKNTFWCVENHSFEHDD